MEEKIINKNILYLVLSIVIIILLLLFCTILKTYDFITKNIKFELKGKAVVYIDVNTTYKDDGVLAQIFDENLNHKVKIKSNLNTEIVGQYKTNYSLSFLGINYKLNRIINVLDKESPQIELKGKSEITIYTNETYIDEGATAYDNYEKDITSNIIKISNLNTAKEGNYEIIYTIKDSSGNENSIARKVIVKKKPVIKKYEPKQTTDIAQYIKKNNYKVSVGYYNLVTGKEYYYQENKIYYGASLIKTLDALYLYDNKLVTKELKPYIKRAISISDNDAHKYLVNQIGKNNLKQYGESLGAPNTLQTDNYYGDTTVMDQIVYLKKLYSMTKNNNELKSYFINNFYNRLTINNLTIMHKYGWYQQYFHDVGIVFDKKPYIVVILTEHGYGDYSKITNELSRIIYEYHIKE